MEYQEFLETVRKEAEVRLGHGRSAAIHRVLKNNSICLNGLVIMDKEENISPTIYLEPFYEKIKAGEDFELVFKEIMQVYEESRVKESVDISFFTDYEKVRSMLFYKLINYNANEELLTLVPHRRFLDLALVTYCLVKNEAVGSASILVYESHLEMWKITEEELFHEAEENTRALGTELAALKELLEEMLTGEEDIEDNEEIEMYVLSNHTRLNGAVCMTYEDELLRIAEQLDSDLYILPSSLHEVILVPVTERFSLERLSQMVHEVNTAQVEHEERLSDHAYLFKREGGFAVPTVFCE